MATVTLTDMKNRFPAGTSVGAYAVSAFPGGWSGGALPSGLSAAATATVASDGSLTFTGLTAAVEYRAYAVVNSEPHWVAFFVDAAASTVGAILPWASGTHYTPGQAVTSGGNTYTANDAHTAGATFAGDKTAHWTALPVSAGSNGEVAIPVFYATDYGVVTGFHGSFPTYDSTIATANTAGLRACIAAAQAHDLGGGTRFGAVVQLPAGVIIFNDRIDVPGNLWLRGAGRGLTELVGILWESNPRSLVRVTSDAAISTISDLGIACVDAAAGLATAHGIEVVGGTAAYGSLGGQVTTIERVIITSAPGNGVDLGGFENRLSDVYVARCGGAGFRITGSDQFVSNCTADTCGATFNESGFKVPGPNNKIFGCKAFGCTGSGFNIGFQRNMIVGCESQDNGLYGFVDNGDNAYAGCLADSNGKAGGTNYGFWLIGGSSAAGCVAMIRDGSTGQKYGYGLAAYNGVYPQIVGTSRLPATAHVDPASEGSINVNNLEGTQQLAYAATITPDPYLGGTVQVGALTGNITVNAPTSGVFKGMKLSLQFTQDATGGRTVTWASAFTGGPVIDTAASAVTAAAFVYDGAKWRLRSTSKQASGGATAFSGARAGVSGATGASNGAFTTQVFDAESWDTDAFHDNATNNSRLTVPSAKVGYVELQAQIQWAANATGTRQVRIMKNGVTELAKVGESASSANTTTLQVASRDLAAAGDYYTVETYQDTGGSLTTTANSWFEIRAVGA